MARTRSSTARRRLATNPAPAIRPAGGSPQPSPSRQPSQIIAAAPPPHAGQTLESQLSKVDFLKLAGSFPSFSGDNGQQPEDYLIQFSKMAKFTGFTSQQLMELIPLKLTSIADTWFSELQLSAEWPTISEAEDPFVAFIEVFTKRFSIGERNQLARDKLRALEWRGSAVKLASLIQQHSAHTNISDHEQCDRFIQLLPADMARHVLLMRTTLKLHSFEDALTMAVDFESASKSQKQGFSRTPRAGSSLFGPSSSKAPGGPSSSKFQKKNPVSFTAPGVKQTTATKGSNGVKPVTPRRCWQCNQTGHFKKDCPLNKTVGLNVMDVDQTQKIIDLSNVSTDMKLMPFANNLLVMDGVINALPVTVMVDGGAGATFMSSRCARRLNLQPTRGEESITVRLADGTVYQCWETVLVPLRISTYKQTVRMFVLDMHSAIDVILGKNWLEFHNPHIDWRRNTVEFLQDDEPVLLSTTPATAVATTGALPLLSASQLSKILKSEEPVYLVQLNQVDSIESDLGLNSLEASAGGSTVAVENQPLVDHLLQDFSDVFCDELPHFLPPERDAVHRIPLEPGHTPPYKRPYRISPKEMSELQKQLKEMIDSGVIQPSSSPYAAPVIFVPKKDGTLRMCIDYRALNKITIKNRFPLPKMDELLNCLHGARFFSKIDLKSAYYQIRVADEDVPKTAFNTRYGHFEFRVMPFGLTNAPATFQELMNSIFKDVMEKFVVVYLDDILIYSPTANMHEEHIRFVLNRLREHKLFASLKKCQFFQTETEFVGYMISADGISMMPHKVEAILNWPVPLTVTQVRSFLGLANFYRRFIRSFAHMALPLNQLTRKHQVYVWLPRHQQAFESLKLALTTAPVLATPDFTLPFEIYTDASDFAAGAVLCQLHEGDSHPRPIAFLSHTFKAAELNYSTYDKEFLSIILAIRTWRHLIHGQPTTIFTDHQALTSIQTQTFINRRHNRYLQLLAEFGSDLVIKYKPGHTNVVADALSRIPTLNLMSTVGPSPEVLQEFAAGYLMDPLTAPFFTEQVGPSKWSLENGLIYEEKNGKKLIYVPASKELRDLLMHDHHDAKIAGHLGRDKTVASLSANFTWPSLVEDVARYVRECPTCQVVKASNQITPGLLTPLEIPRQRWERIHLDLIGPLPVTARKNNAILTVVDRLSKAAIFIPTTMNVTAKHLAELFFNNVFRHYGLPSVIISDRDPRFTSNFWRALMNHLGISLHMTAAFHPQSDGQAERHNRTIQDMLRAYVNPATRNDWDQHLVALEFAYNNSVHRATGYSPFYMLYGQNPNTPASLLHTSPSISPAVDEFLAQITNTLAQAQLNLAKNQQEMQRQANRRRRHVEYEVGQRVLVNASRLFQAPTGKLTHKWVGPFEIAEVLNSNSYVLHLPEHLQRTSPTFNVTHLKLYHESDRSYPCPPPIGYENNQPIYEFEKILAHKGPKNNREYLVQWKGWPVDENIYEPAEMLTGVQADVDAYEAALPNKKRRRR